MCWLWRARSAARLEQRIGMAKVEIYSTMWCGYCARARALLQRKGVAFEEIDVDADGGKRVEMVKRAGGRTT
ncbi:MAG: glutaredoxin domain-containing protein, partial [Stellaceae bacterium]